MRYQINLGLRQQSVPVKIETGRTIIKRMSSSSFFAAPNPLPHPSLSSVDAIITDMESAYLLTKDGGKSATHLLKKRVKAYVDAITELAHYVADLANANPLQAEAIIVASGMQMKHFTKATIPDFSLKHGELSGTVMLKVRATKRAVYIFEMSSGNVGSVNELVWKTISIGSKASVTVSGLTPGTTYYFRYAIVINNEQTDFSDAMHIVAV